MAVGLEHLADSEPAAQFEELLVLVGRIQQDGIPGFLATQDVHVVVHGADHQLVDLGPVVLVVHAPQPMD